MQKVLWILIVIQLAQHSFCALGVDVSQLFSHENYTCMKNSGISFAVVRGYCSFGGIDTHAVQSLRNVQSAGLATDIYMFPCRGKNATAQVD